MFKSRLIATVLVAFLSFGMSAQAGTIVIDSFFDVQLVTDADGPGGTVVPGGLDPSPHILGGYRAAIAGETNVIDIGSGVATIFSPSFFDATIEWGGAPSPFGLPGLGGVDLTDDGTNDTFAFGGFSIDAPEIIPTEGEAIPDLVTATLTVADTEGGSASSFGKFSFIDIIEGGFPTGPVFVPFLDFVGLVDFSSVAFISLDFSSLVDPTITLTGPFVTTSLAPVPVPAALPLFLSGLLGLGVMARRRKQKMAAA